MAQSITSRTAREKLKPRREPYWARIQTGLYVGYRRLERGEGTWIARRRNELGRQEYRALGTFADYDEATRAAVAWVAELAAGTLQAPVAATVREACSRYVEHLRLQKSAASAKDAQGRFKRLVYSDPIADIPLSKLQAADLKDWLADQLEVEDEEDEDELRRAKDSANRNLASFKAALNLAWKDGLVASDAAWRTVVPFRGVGRRRQGFVPLEQRSALLSTCEPDLAALVRALLLTAARPGELARATVRDFDRAQGTLVLSGKTGPRTVTLSSSAARFVQSMAEGKAATDFLLAQASGAAWNKDVWKKRFKEAAAAAGLPPDVVMYSLRHTAISERIAGGMDTFVVAKLAGTSTAMIDKHYGHLRHDRTRDMLDSVVLL